MRILRTLFLFAAPLLLLLLFLSYSALAIDGARHGLSLFLKTVFPSLFPFLVLSDLILSSGSGYTIGGILSRPFRALFGISRAGSGALALGILCGQPVASSCAASLCEKKEITPKEAQRISLFGNNPSSGFLVAAVGGVLFGNTAAGTALFCITLLSCGILGFLLRLFFGKVAQNEEKCRNGMDKRPFFTLFTDAVQHAFSCVFLIGAFLVFFSSFSFVLKGFLMRTPLDAKCYPWLFGCLEITGGIHTGVTALSPYSAFRLAAFLCGFGGICVCMQILSIAKKCGLSVGVYLLAKLFQGGISLLLCECYLRLFKPILSPPQSIPTGTLSTRLPAYTFAILLIFAVLLFLNKRKAQKRKVISNTKQP